MSSSRSSDNEVDICSSTTQLSVRLRERSPRGDVSANLLTGDECPRKGGEGWDRTRDAIGLLSHRPRSADVAKYVSRIWMFMLSRSYSSQSSAIVLSPCG